MEITKEKVQNEIKMLVESYTTIIYNQDTDEGQDMYYNIAWGRFLELSELGLISYEEAKAALHTIVDNLTPINGADEL